MPYSNNDQNTVIILLENIIFDKTRIEGLKMK